MSLKTIIEGLPGRTGTVYTDIKLNSENNNFLAFSSHSLIEVGYFEGAYTFKTKSKTWYVAEGSVKAVVLNDDKKTSIYDAI